MDSDHLLTPEAAAARLGCSKSTLAKARMSGSGVVFVKIGRLVRYRAADQEAFVGARVRASTSESEAG